MRAILFCKNPYAFGILAPLYEAMLERDDTALWYVPEKLLSTFPFPDQVNRTSSMADLLRFKPDAVFVPGNEVPHYLRGVKVQVFHGLAGEKKGHFRVRHYFDLYLTQGPYFTRRFKELAERFGDFEAIETGWPKLDPLFKDQRMTEKPGDSLSKVPDAPKFVLYAPTFSPSLTSAPDLLQPLTRIANDHKMDILLKFHDLMDHGIREKYEKLAQNLSNVTLETEPDIVPLLLKADVLISDTSSVVYEFLLLNKPVITYKTRSAHPAWQNVEDAEQLPMALEQALR
jgi:CDP-ribitol ribitolphosphotransferase / teichoic acid ribitol-phosphate polymerase